MGSRIYSRKDEGKSLAFGAISSDLLIVQFRNCFQEIRLRLFQLTNEPPMTVTINRLSFFYIAKQRILSRIHFRFCGLDLLHVAH